MGCECGEVGCWPFLASIAERAGEVQWFGFQQPFRPGWKYDSLGTLRFAAGDYHDETARAEARFAEVARLPDEFIAARAASLRKHIEIALEITEGILLAWHRRDELLRLSADDLSLIKSEAYVRDAATDEVVRRLGVTPRQGGVIAMRDIHAMSAAEIASHERFRSDLMAAKAAPDDFVRDAYNQAVARQRSEAPPS